MDANPTYPDLVHELADIGAGKPFVRMLAETRPRYIWHVALTLPGQDRQAADALRRRKYRVYRPLIWYQARTRGRLMDSAKSMFPGYLFVLPHPAGWEPLRESPGVRDLMRINDRFATLADDDPDFRRIEAMEGELTKMPQKSAKYRVGQAVRVEKGPFVELTGHIAALDNKGRADVLIDLLKRKVRLSCSLDQLNPV